MNKKKFKIFKQPLISIDKLFVIVESEEEILNVKEVVDLLNSLQEENEQLKQELDNFKPVIFQDIRKGTVILYSKEG